MTLRTPLQQFDERDVSAVASEIARIGAAANRIATAIEEKGGQVPYGTKIDGLHECVRSIPAADYNTEYPVGRVVMFYDDADHSNFLGFTWERCLIGRFPVGINPSETEFSSIGQQGGEKTHSLTTSEVPGLSQDGVAALDGNNDRVTGYSGNGQPHNNIPPYEVVSFWRRTA